MLASLLRPLPPRNPPLAFAPAAGPYRRGTPPPALPPASKALIRMTAALGANGTAQAQQVLAELSAESSPWPNGRRPWKARWRHCWHKPRWKMSRCWCHGWSHRRWWRPTRANQSPTTFGNALASVRSSASAQFGQSLAKALLSEAVSPAQRDPFLKVLCEPQPLNLEAEVLIYQSELADSAMRAALEKQFAAASADALRTFLGFPAPRKRRPAAGWIGSTRLAGSWVPPLTEFLGLAVATGGNAGQGAGADLVGRHDSQWHGAHGLRRLVGRHWSEGPQAVRTAHRRRWLGGTGVAGGVKISSAGKHSAQSVPAASLSRLSSRAKLRRRPSQDAPRRRGQKAEGRGRLERTDGRVGAQLLPSLPPGRAARWPPLIVRRRRGPRRWRPRPRSRRTPTAFPARPIASTGPGSAPGYPHWPTTR